MNEIKIGVCGLGRMGRYHLSIYEKIAQEKILPIKIVAVCDIDEDKLYGRVTAKVNLSNEINNNIKDEYHKYTNINEMLENEDLDMVDIVVPTYLHAEYSVKVLNKGINCFCEKPMALNTVQCDEMINAAKKNDKLLMIGHCLRFWREYVYLKDCVVDNRYGKCLGAYFYRGGYADHVNNPSWQDWIITREKGGGALFDQHIHDTDAINWIFGTPSHISVHGQKFFKNSAHDIVSASYGYDDKVITALDDISYRGLPFEYGYTVNFEKACLRYQNNKLTVFHEDCSVEEPDLTLYGTEDAYFNEIFYFIKSIINGKKIEKCPPSDSKDTIRLSLLEMISADSFGKTMISG